MRAKLKQFSEIPEKYKCCETVMSRIRIMTHVFEVDPTDAKPMTKTCPDCGMSATSIGIRCAVGHLPADCLDIEEGS